MTKDNNNTLNSSKLLEERRMNILAPQAITEETDTSSLV